MTTESQNLEDSKNMIVFFAEALENYSKLPGIELSESNYQRLVEIYLGIRARGTLINSEMNELTNIVGTDIVEECKEVATKRVAIGRTIRKMANSGIRFDLEEEED